LVAGHTDDAGRAAYNLRRHRSVVGQESS
jgi:outer membrane protein OmpA-like peptidoglycan-associated protein